MLHSFQKPLYAIIRTLAAVTAAFLGVSAANHAPQQLEGEYAKLVPLLIILLMVILYAVIVFVKVFPIVPETPVVQAYEHLIIAVVASFIYVSHQESQEIASWVPGNFSQFSLGILLLFSFLLIGHYLPRLL